MRVGDTRDIEARSQRIQRIAAVETWKAIGFNEAIIAIRIWASQRVDIAMSSPAVTMQITLRFYIFKKEEKE